MGRPFRWQVWKGKQLLGEGRTHKLWDAILEVDRYRQAHDTRLTCTVWDAEGVIVWPVDQIEGAGPREPLEP